MSNNSDLLCTECVVGASLEFCLLREWIGQDGTAVECLGGETGDGKLDVEYQNGCLPVLGELG